MPSLTLSTTLKFILISSQKVSIEASWLHFYLWASFWTIVFGELMAKKIKNANICAPHHNNK